MRKKISRNWHTIKAETPCHSGVPDVYMCQNNIIPRVEINVTNNNRDIVLFYQEARNYADCRSGGEIGE